MAKSKIEWTHSVWNPVTGCTPVSEGCQKCWAKRMATRLKGRFGYPADDPFRVTFHPDRLEDPIGWHKPRHIFVSSMGDLFHEDVKDEWINKIFAMMTSPIFGAPQHTYILLTKRPVRILAGHPEHFAKWPNIWLGVTVESDKYKWRIDDLLQIQAAVRFVSYEPALGPLTELYEYLQWNQLHWVIAGCESGPGRRPAKIEWFRDIKDQCVEAEIPFFLKQREVEFGNGKLGIEKRPMLDGRVWDQLPG